MKIKRQDLRELATLRLREAQLLLGGGCWSGSYYLSGYSIECAIKACIAKGTDRYEFPDLERVRSSYTHDLVKLLRVANLSEPLAEAMRDDRQLTFNWALVREWSQEARYEQHTETDAAELLTAIQDRKFGVLPWLKKRW